MIHVFIIELDAACWHIALDPESILCFSGSAIFNFISYTTELQARASATKKHTVKNAKWRQFN